MHDARQTSGECKLIHSEIARSKICGLFLDELRILGETIA